MKCLLVIRDPFLNIIKREWIYDTEPYTLDLRGAGSYGCYVGIVTIGPTENNDDRLTDHHFTD